MARVKICVTDNDIKRGVQSDAANCPIAKAFKRVCKKASCIQVGPDSDIYGIIKNEEVWFIDYTTDKKEEEYHVVKLPKKASEWGDKFDDNKKSVKPIEFFVTVPND